MSQFQAFAGVPTFNCDSPIPSAMAMPCTISWKAVAMPIIFSIWPRCVRNRAAPATEIMLPIPPLIAVPAIERGALLGRPEGRPLPDAGHSSSHGSAEADLEVGLSGIRRILSARERAAVGVTEEHRDVTHRARVVAKVREREIVPHAIDELAEELIARFGAKDLPLRHYTYQRLFSPEARFAWLEPDLEPL